MALGGDHVHGVLQRTDDGGKVFPRGIKAAGADIVAYGAPVLPGAMFLLGYFEDGTPVMGLPGCVMYAAAKLLDLIHTKNEPEVPLNRPDNAALGEGGLCLGCAECHYVS